MTTKRKIPSKQLKFQAAIALLTEKCTLEELTQQYGVHYTALYRWKKEFLEHGSDLFARGGKPKTEAQAIDALQRKIGQLTMEIDFLKNSQKRSPFPVR